MLSVLLSYAKNFRLIVSVLSHHVCFLFTVSHKLHSRDGNNCGRAGNCVHKASRCSELKCSQWDSGTFKHFSQLRTAPSMVTSLLLPDIMLWLIHYHPDSKKVREDDFHLNWVDFYCSFHYLQSQSFIQQIIFHVPEFSWCLSDHSLYV